MRQIGWADWPGVLGVDWTDVLVWAQRAGYQIEANRGGVIVASDGCGSAVYVEWLLAGAPGRRGT